MAMELQTELTDRYLLVKVLGQFSLEDANNSVVRLFEIIVDQNADRVLVDCSTLEGNVSIMQQYLHAKFFSESLAASGASKGVRFAYILTGAFKDSDKFGETVAVNRAVNLRTFDNSEDAIQWLMNNKVEEKQ